MEDKRELAWELGQGGSSDRSKRILYKSFIKEIHRGAKLGRERDVD